MSMAIFNSVLYVYQRVYGVNIGSSRGSPGHPGSLANFVNICPNVQ